MTNPRIWATALIAAGVLAATATPASAHALYQTRYDGVWSTQAGCEQIRALMPPPPEAYTNPCFYRSSDPDRYQRRGPGWYYWAKVWVD